MSGVAAASSTAASSTAPSSTAPSSTAATSTALLQRTLLECGALHLRGPRQLVCAEILRCRDALLQQFPPPPPPPALPPYDRAAANRRIEASLSFVLRECRQVTFVAFLAGAPRLVAVLCADADYVCPFRLQFDEATYRAAKAAARPDLRPEPPWVPVAAQWASHGILCNQAPPLGFSAAMVPEFVAFLGAVAAAAPPQALEQPFEFLLNRRACPLLPQDPAAHPYGFVGPSCRLRAPPPPRPLRVLSLYVGDGWRDGALVEPTPWRPATAVAWRNKQPVALFRGSSTGRGTTPRTNVRLALCALQDPRVDAGITTWSSRDKLVGNDCVEFQPVLWPTAKPIPAAAWSHYKYLLYAEGYSAALRLGPMLSTGSAIIWVHLPSYETSANRMWYYAELPTYAWTGLPWDGDAGGRAAVVRCAVDALPALLDYLDAHDDAAAQLGSNARRAFHELNARRVPYMVDALAAVAVDAVAAVAPSAVAAVNAPSAVASAVEDAKA